MSTPLQCSWSGVFPAATTQYGADLTLDTKATSAVQAALVRDGVHGLVLLGTVGENNSLSERTDGSPRHGLCPDGR